MAKTRSRGTGRGKGYPQRGEIYLTALDPALGHEIKKTRPALVIQNEPDDDRHFGLGATRIAIEGSCPTRPFVPPDRAHQAAFPCAADIVGHHLAGAPTMPRPASNGIATYQVNPSSRWAVGPAHPAMLTATRVATRAMSTFFIGVPLSSRHAMHTSCLAAPLVVRCPQWFTASGHSGSIRRGLCPWGHS